MGYVDDPSGGSPYLTPGQELNIHAGENWIQDAERMYDSPMPDLGQFGIVSINTNFLMGAALGALGYWWWSKRR
jgi:hypothetical protein